MRDLIALRATIAKESPAGAGRVVLRILHDIENLLPEYSRMGRPGHVSDTRELVIPGTPYIVPYRVQSDAIPESESGNGVTALSGGALTSPNVI